MYNVRTLMYSSASSGVNAPLSLRRSTKHTATHPSTLRMSCHVLSHRVRSKRTHGVLPGRRHLLDAQRVIQQTVTRKVLRDVLLDEFDTKIRIVHALDLMSYTRDCAKPWK